MVSSWLYISLLAVISPHFPPYFSFPFFFFLLSSESFLHPSLAFFGPLCHPISSAPLCMRFFTTWKGSVRIFISTPKSGCPNLKGTHTNMIIDSKMPGLWRAWCRVFCFCFCFFPSFILLSGALWKAVNVCHMDLKSKTVFPSFSDLLGSKGPYFKILQGLSITWLFNPDQWLHRGGESEHIPYLFFTPPPHILSDANSIFSCVFYSKCFVRSSWILQLLETRGRRDGEVSVSVLMLVDWRRGILQIIGLWQCGRKNG